MDRPRIWIDPDTSAQEAKRPGEGRMNEIEQTKAGKNTENSLYKPIKRERKKGRAGEVRERYHKWNVEAYLE
jgi:hypothetical protein